MKKVIYVALSIVMLFALSSCNWFNTTFLGKPSKAELAKKEQLEKMRKDSLARVEMEKAITEQQMLEQHMMEETTQQKDDGKRFHVIVGSFKVSSNADRMMRLLQDKGYQPQLMNFKNGFSCISVSSYANVHTAYNEMYKILKSDFAPLDIWVYDTTFNLHQN